MNKSKLILIIAATLTGCASVTGTTNQSVSVQVMEDSGREVNNARCDLTNKRGTWYLTSPGSVMIHRSNDPLLVTCKKQGLENGRTNVESSTKGGMFGNILLGGGIGAIVDHSNGSAYEYPNLIQVVMGKFTDMVIPKKAQEMNANPMMGAAPSQTSSVEKVGVSQQINSPIKDNEDANNDKQKRLIEIRDLHEQGLISDEVYIDAQKKALDSK